MRFDRLLEWSFRTFAFALEPVADRSRHSVKLAVQD